MGKSELLMVLAGIALSIMIALITIPTFTKGSDLAKISLINSDISSIRKVSQTYVESKSPTGDFKNINAEAISSLIPDLKLVGSGNTSYFTSGANDKIIIRVSTNGANDVLIIRIEGLKNENGSEVIDGAEKSIIQNQEKLNINTPDTLIDGTVVLHFKG